MSKGSIADKPPTILPPAYTWWYMPPPLRRAHIYVAEGKPTIIAPVHFNSAGILYEQSDPLVAKDTDWEAVVQTLRAALERFSFREANLREQRLTDWPSYQASGVRSVCQFQSDYLCIQIRAVNEAELFYDALSQPLGEPDITLHVTLNPYGSDGEIARLLARLHQACRQWQTVMCE
jgi:hypothetical protein